MVARIDEVWHFTQSSDTMFSDYVKTFLQYKQEAISYPEQAVSEVDKRAYIDDYFEKENIMLNPDKIVVNQARRSINKLLLNSIWGRFSMRENPSFQMLKDPEQFAQHNFGNAYDVTHFSFVSEDVALIQWRHADGYSGQTHDTTVFLGAFTTALARLELYDLIDKLGDLYSDTDSVVFVSKDGDWELSLGPLSRRSDG